MKHGEVTREGDEFNHDDMCYCAKCGTSHTHFYAECDGLRGGYVPLEPNTFTVHKDMLGHHAPAIARQEGGAHYKGVKIQPFEYIHANGLPFAEGCVVKYVSRWRSKGGVEDLKKARHFLDLLIEAEGGGK